VRHQPGGSRVAILSHGLWQRRFGGEQNIVGKAITLNDADFTVIGVLPANFRFFYRFDVWVPLQLDPQNELAGETRYYGTTVARLKPGVTLSQANDDIARMIPLIVKQFPPESAVARQVWQEAGLAPNVRRLSEDVIGEMSRPLWILLGTVGIVLLMAWANVANLLLVRAEGRQLPVAEAIQPAGARPDPEAALAVLEERRHVVVREPVLRREGVDAPVAEAVQAARERPDPDVAASVLEDRGDLVARQAVLRAQRREPLDVGHDASGVQRFFDDIEPLGIVFELMPPAFTESTK